MVNYLHRVGGDIYLSIFLLVCVLAGLCKKLWLNIHSEAKALVPGTSNKLGD